jgi:hypothetical protein
MTKARHRSKQSSPQKAGSPRRARAGPKAAAKPKATATLTERPAAAPEGPTLRSQAQVEIRLGRGARPLTATEQAARLAGAQMERRIGRLLWRRVKLKFR